MAAALGFALAQWHTVETALYNLYVYLCGYEDERAVNVVFHEMSVDVKLRAIGALINLRDSSRSKSWNRLRNDHFSEQKCETNAPIGEL